MIPQRRSASVTAVAWRTSAGAAARVPVARATNLTRTLKDWANRGLQVIGLDADGDITIDELDGSGPIVVVVGSEGKGLSRLVRENCDAVVSIPMTGPTESLNASVAAGVVLRERGRPPKVAPEAAPRRRRRRQCGRSRCQCVRNRQRIKHFGGHSLMSHWGEVDTVAVPQTGIAELREPPEVHQVHTDVVDDGA